MDSRLEMALSWFLMSSCIMEGLRASSMVCRSRSGSMKLAEPIPRASRPPRPPRDPRPNGVAPTSADKWSALFNFQSLLTVILLLICTCAYIRSIFPSLLDRNKINRNVLEMCPDRRKEESLCCVLLRHNGGKHLVLVIDFDPLDGSSTTEPRPSNYIYYRVDLSCEQ
uniref:Protein kish n=1 Tax=Timema genevievae TaxID=629358 RepID=A0A7R9JWQ7_TIMGE|nr:unnamed protein product [Timema genevievae]